MHGSVKQFASSADGAALKSCRPTVRKNVVCVAVRNTMFESARCPVRPNTDRQYCRVLLDSRETKARKLRGTGAAAQRKPGRKSKRPVPKNSLEMLRSNLLGSNVCCTLEMLRSMEADMIVKKPYLRFQYENSWRRFIWAAS